MNQQQIEDYLEKKINSLDSKIQDRFVYIFDDGDGIRTTSEGLSKCFATCSMGLKPPVITFFTKWMSENNFQEHNLDGVINHEIVHTFGLGEKEAHEKEDIIDFTKKHA